MQAHRGGGETGGDPSTAAGAPALLTQWQGDAPAAAGLLRSRGACQGAQDPVDLARIGHASRAGHQQGAPVHRCHATDASARGMVSNPRAATGAERRPLTHQPFKARCTGSRAVVLEARLTRVIGPCARVCCAVYGISVGPNRISLLLLPWIAACVSCRHPLSSVIALRWQAPISHDGRSLDEVAGPAFTQVRANTDQVSAWQSLAEMVGPGPHTAGRQTVWK